MGTPEVQIRLSDYVVPGRGDCVMNKISRMSELPESERLYPVPPEEMSSLGKEGEVSPDDPSDLPLGHQTRAAKSQLLERLFGRCEAVPHRRGDGTIVPVYFIRQG